MEVLLATDGVVAAKENKRLKLEKQAVSDTLHWCQVDSHREITAINKDNAELLAENVALRQQVETLTAENQKLQADFDEAVASHPAYDSVKQPSGGTPQQHRSVAQYTGSPDCLPTLPLYTDRWAALSQGLRLSTPSFAPRWKSSGGEGRSTGIQQKQSKEWRALSPSSDLKAIRGISFGPSQPSSFKGVRSGVGR
jgi:hypothetical protein